MCVVGRAAHTSVVVGGFSDVDCVLLLNLSSVLVRVLVRVEELALVFSAWVALFALRTL